MAIKIGHKKESEIKPYWKVSCDKCGCVFLATTEDIDHDAFQYNEYCYSVSKCPECGHSISFNKTDKATVPSKEDLAVVNNQFAPLPSKDDILKAFWIFDKYGLIKDDLSFDPEHFINTVVMPNWRDFIPKFESPGSKKA